VVGALYFAVNAAGSERMALSASLSLLAAAIVTCAAFAARPRNVGAKYAQRETDFDVGLPVAASRAHAL
jgi:hypothetical protein